MLVPTADRTYLSPRPACCGDIGISRACQCQHQGVLGYDILQG